LIAHEYRNKFTGPDRLFKALDLMAGDSDMTCNTEEFAQKMSNNGNKVYRYFYNHRSSVDPWPKWSGVKHGDELEFTFGTPLRNPHLYNANEIKLARDIIIYWTNFAKTGLVFMPVYMCIGSILGEGPVTAKNWSFFFCCK
jgi:acetylcholinesterase